MKTKSKGRQHRACAMAAIGFALALLLANAQTTKAQWTTGTNINNTNSGNVGIGTTSPGSALEVSAAVPIIAITGSTSNAFRGLSLKDGNTEIGTLQSNGNSGELRQTAGFATWGGFQTFYTNGLERVRIGSSGNIGIGTTSPGSALEVSAAVPIITMTGSTSNAFRGLSLKDGSTEIGTLQSNGNSGELRQTAGFATWGGFQTFYTNGLERIRIDSSGNVGIGTGTTAPTQKLDVVGNINVSGTGAGNITLTGTINAKYQDVAEWVPSSEQLSAGTVVVLDSTKSNQVTSSLVSYDTRVAGVVSEQPGIALGEKSESKVLVATTGRVKVKVDASKGAIHIGDLLVTSDIPGAAMKSEPVNLGGIQLHRPGTLIGKALEPLERGKGEILVLLSLQ